MEEVDIHCLQHDARVSKSACLSIVLSISAQSDESADSSPSFLFPFIIIIALRAMLGIPHMDMCIQ